MKKIGLLLLALGFSSSAMAESLANDILKNDTMNGMGGIRMILMAKGKKCDPKVVDVKVVQQPTDIRQERGAIVGGYWKESWTIDCNGEQIVFPIKFVLDPTGASYVITVSK